MLIPQTAVSAVRATVNAAAKAGVFLALDIFPLWSRHHVALALSRLIDAANK
jgi:hypothetical protein